ncbi:SecDF P1 head subdomain-containing protein [Kitasatospora sp. NE20-6]|uniref:SecDF P1 head subdomain-containing protein n=1 Tax=Kitasatospora sp. NE20-6 TaxID=2859066 RepID=UPI0038B3559E
MTPPRHPAPSAPRAALHPVPAALSALLLAAAALTGCTASGTGARTTVVFTPEQPLDKPVLQQAATVLTRRAARIGLKDVKARIGNGTIEVSAAGSEGDRIAGLAAGALLTFRPVQAVADAADGTTEGTVPDELRSAFDTLKCPADLRPAAPAKPTVACGKQPRTLADRRYALAPSAMHGNTVAGAELKDSTGDGTAWIVSVRFTPDGTKAFTAVTTALAGPGAATGELAITLDGRVVSSLVVVMAITDPTTDIHFYGDREAATEVAERLSDGSLPMPMRVSAPKPG